MDTKCSAVAVCFYKVSHHGQQKTVQQVHLHAEMDTSILLLERVDEFC